MRDMELSNPPFKDSLISSYLLETKFTMKRK